MNPRTRHGMVLGVPELEPADTSILREEACAGTEVPAVVAASPSGIGLAEWVRSRREELQSLLGRRGAVLLRGFACDGSEPFLAAVRSVSASVYSGYGDLTPAEPARGLYGTTFYPEERAIQFHNEGAHRPEWPLYLFFLNVQAPLAGGATRLVDGRRVLAGMDRAFLERLRREPLRYVRNHHPGVDTSWQALYGSSDPREVERRCRAMGVEFRWTHRDTLRTSITTPAIVLHPATGEELPFHQIFLFHPACLDEATRAGLFEIYAPAELPRHVEWASGAPLDDRDVRTLFALYRQHAKDVRWRAGDVVMLDNVRVAHGREDYSGPRRLLVSMTDRVQRSAARATTLVSARPELRTADPTAPLRARHYEPVPGVFRSQALSAPTAIAVTQAGRQWTYAELDLFARRTAAALERLALAPGSAIGVTGPRSFELVAAVLGVWFAGHVVVPIESDLPAARKEILLAEANVVALLTTEAARDFGAGIPHLDLEQLGHGELDSVELGANETDFELGVGRPDDPAYVFFTSGSTGVPKGVLGTHQGLAHFLDWQRQTFDVGPGDRVAQLTSLGFDVVLRDIFLPLTSGATLCLPPPSLDRLDPWPWFTSEGITRLHAVPSIASVWLQRASRSAAAPPLRTVFFAGEPLSEALVRRFRVLSSAEIVNLYGPTETTLAKCFHRVVDIAPGVQPIGRPLPGAQVLILDERGRLSGAGETGEIVLRTPFRTRGYVGGTTEEHSRFGPNPFHADPNDIVYYTGDLGRLRDDGLLDILGRKDDQIKVLGVRVEPQEASAALLLDSRVKQAFVGAAYDDARTGGSAYLVAYVVADEREASAASLRAFLAERLPAAAIPRRFVHLPALPLGPNGKVDRRALERLNTAPARHAPAVQPVTDVERQLVPLWQTLLKIETPGADDDFFERGGDSLLALQLVARVRRELGVPLGIHHVFESPTLRALARCIDELGRGSRGPAQRGVALSSTSQEPHGASFAQQRLWFLSRWARDGGAYNIPGAVRFDGSLDVGILHAVVEALVERHPSLRTSFREVDGTPEPRLDPTARAAVTTLDFSHEPSARRSALVHEAALDITRRPFDLARAPLARFALIKESETAHVLVYALHHTIADGWSNFVLNRELCELYVAMECGAPSPLPALQASYADFALREREQFREVEAQELAFWRAYLDGAPARLELPSDRPRPAVQTFHGGSTSRALPAALVTALERTTFGAERSTLFMKLLAGFNALLHEQCGTRDVVVGTPVARRGDAEFDSVIGCFINTLAVRTLLPERATFQAVLDATRSSLLAAFAHQDTPFERVVKAVAPPRAASHSPIFQVLFNYLSFAASVTTTPRVSMRREHLVAPQTKFDLTLYARHEVDAVSLHLVYNADLFEQKSMQRLLERYEGILEEALSQPGRIFEHVLRPEAAGAAAPVLATAPSVSVPEGEESVRAAIEAWLSDLWREVLGRDCVLPTDDFFALGGHSLLALQVLSRVHGHFGAVLPLWTIFQHPTPRALAACTLSLLAEPGRSAQVQIPRVSGSASQLSLDQARLWALHRGGLDRHYYNVPRAVRVKGPLNVDLLHAALQALVRHHAALGSVVEESVLGPRTRPIEEPYLGLELVDDVEAAATIDREARRGFRLAEELPVRVALVRHAPEDHTLVVTAHHIAVDCWSLGPPFQVTADQRAPWHPGIFFADLMKIYHALEERRPFPLRPQLIRFGDFAAWQHGRLLSGGFAEHAAFFQSELGDAPREIDLPTDKRGPVEGSLRGARYEFPIPSELGPRAERLRRARQTTLFLPLLAAFGLAMRRWSGQDDLVVGTPVSNRNRPETENLIGPVGNTLALRVRVPRDESPAALIASLRDSVSRSFAYQEYPFAELTRALGATGGTRSPVFQVRFILQQASEVPFALPHLELSPVKIDRGVSKYDLSLIVAEQGQRLRGWCEYRTELFELRTIQSFVATYLESVGRVIGAHDV